MLDLLVYRMSARLDRAPGGTHRYVVAGRSCLAGDVFGTFDFTERLSIGSLIPLADAAAYVIGRYFGFDPLTPEFNGSAVGGIVAAGIGRGLGVQIARRLRARR